MERILIEFLFELNQKGFVKDYDFQFENQVKEFLKKYKKKSLLK